jgi:hypothetical protein
VKTTFGGGGGFLFGTSQVTDSRCPKATSPSQEFNDNSENSSCEATVPSSVTNLATNLLIRTETGEMSQREISQREILQKNIKFIGSDCEWMWKHSNRK